MTTEHAEEHVSAGSAAAQARVRPGPRGIGTGVVFDWALVVQILIDGVFYALGTGPGSAMAGKPLGLRLAIVPLTLLAAAIVFTQGEALRRGRRVAWIIQIVANALLVINGLIGIPGTITSLGKLRFGDLSYTIVLVIISALIVWLLTRPSTRAWIGSTTSAEARARHGGSWLFWIALWAIIGGAAIAFAGYY